MPYTTKTVRIILILKVNHRFFRNSFFPSTNSKSFPTFKKNILQFIRPAANFVPSTNSKSFPAFKKNILQFIRPAANFVHNSHNPKEIKFITRPRLG